MIEVIGSSSVHGTVEETVEAALDAIVKHFKDPAHKLDNDAIAATANNKKVPPVVQFWIDRLMASIQDNDGDISELKNRLMRGYSRWIRPCVFRRESITHTTISVFGIPVLLHYEMLLAKLLEQGNAIRTPDISSNTELMVLSERYNNLEKPNDNLQFLYLDSMASDISLLTKLVVQIQAKEKEQDHANNKFEEPSLSVVAKIALPAMIRLVTHCTNANLIIAQQEREALQKCMVAILAFGNPRLDPRDLVSNLETSLLVVQENPSFLYAPIDPTTEGSPTDSTTYYLNTGPHLKEKDFWDPLRLNGSSWEGLETSRAVHAFWGHLLHILKPNSGGNSESASLIALVTSSDDQSDNDQVEEKVGGEVPMQTSIRDCLRDQNQGDIARAVRAHFFGRDVTPLPEDRLTTTTPATRLHLGREVVVEEDPMKRSTKPFLESPSRVHVAMHYILLLELEDFQRQDPNILLAEILPILYELLSANAPAHVGMGASGLIHLLSLTTNDHSTATTTGFVFAKWAGSLLPVLDMACQVCREGLPLALLARAQSLLCGISAQFDSKDDNFAKHRRKTTRAFFTVLDKHNHQVSDPDGLLWALMVGGILPLLYQHATVSEAIDNVDAMEIGRLGLTALLPILRYSGGWSLDANNGTDHAGDNASRKLLAPSVLALVYLLQAAYPIMPRHGGKIMSELLGLLGNLKRQNLSAAADLQLLTLVKNAAGIALVICGERAAQVLDLVTSSTDFEAVMVELVDDIRLRGEQWQQAQQQQQQAITGTS